MALPDLILPDVHENIGRVERILARYLPRVARVTALGDYFDSFTSTDETVLRTCAWLRETLADPRFDHLLGNHDVQYLWPQAQFFRCSGWSPRTLLHVQRQLQGAPLDALRQIRRRVALERAGWVLSHAGLHPHHVPVTGWSQAWIDQEVGRAAARLAMRTTLGWWIWSVGFDRGGRAAFGGPLWLDWGSLPDDTTVIPRQLVGHTPGQEVRRKGPHVCLDTGLRHVGLLYADGTLEIEAV